MSIHIVDGHGWTQPQLLHTMTKHLILVLLNITLHSSDNFCTMHTAHVFAHNQLKYAWYVSFPNCTRIFEIKLRNLQALFWRKSTHGEIAIHTEHKSSVNCQINDSVGRNSVANSIKKLWQKHSHSITFSFIMTAMMKFNYCCCCCTK